MFGNTVVGSLKGKAMKGFKPTDEGTEATEIIELATEQIETLASAFELIASMLGDADSATSERQVEAAELAAATLH